MPIEISVRDNTVSLVSKGVSSAEDVAQQLIELYQSPEFPEEPIMFWDLRASKSFGERTGMDMGMIASKTAHLTKEIRFRTIFLVPNDLYHGMARMAAAHGGAEADAMHIFRSESEALACLSRLESKESE